ncbi:hypothetical protein LCGC14_1213630 [marine sediment metagenome]|uniref:Uncharacterized protein n=1 Tax=marine sediment metagenome TaxID=412755 RepID=A0A0F9M0R2_9ZZZZ
MKRIKAIRHRIEQRTADRKHARRRKSYLFRLVTKASVVREIDPQAAIRNTPMPTTGKIGEFVKALKRK